MIRDLPPTGQAGTDIEITPEMIEAAIEVILDHPLFEHAPKANAQWLAESILQRVFQRFRQA